MRLVKAVLGRVNELGDVPDSYHAVDRVYQGDQAVGTTATDSRVEPEDRVEPWPESRWQTALSCSFRSRVR
jgi:hypothetical protein